MVNKFKNESKKTNPILWFLFAIIIPIIVAITIAFIIFTVAGVNAVDWVKKTGNNIPVISSLITTDEEKAVTQKEEKKQADLASKDAEIEQLSRDISNLESTIDTLEQQIIKYEKNSESVSKDGDSDQSQNENVKELSASFKDMDHKQAALIIQTLDNDHAIAILKAMSTKARGNILEAMDYEEAAKLTQLLLVEKN